MTMTEPHPCVNDKTSSLEYGFTKSPGRTVLEESLYAKSASPIKTVQRMLSLNSLSFKKTIPAIHPESSPSEILFDSLDKHKVHQPSKMNIKRLSVQSTRRHSSDGSIGNNALFGIFYKRIQQDPIGVAVAAEPTGPCLTKSHSASDVSGRSNKTLWSIQHECTMYIEQEDHDIYCVPHTIKAGSEPTKSSQLAGKPLTCLPSFEELIQHGLYENTSIKIKFNSIE